jgi:hypothetical protein
MRSGYNWTDVLKLRPEVIAADGGVGDLQMSLHRAVYQTAKVPYQDVGYYGDITQPTPNLVGFFARVARRLSGSGESVALYHLDQGMGGGKSHALVGLYHMVANPKGFFATHIGKDVLVEAQAGGATIGFDSAAVVTLTADYFSPGKATETFGPAVNLFERFLWSLFDGDRTRYDAAVSQGANKATIQHALNSVGHPVLILLDELMDYAMDLSSVETVGTMPAEQSFLNALMDACDDVPHVAFVLVMIRSDLDREGYTPLAQDFREYLAARINRNGATIAVTETGDFSAIIRRRIFEQASFDNAAAAVATNFRKAVEADAAWNQHVFDKLGSGKTLATLGDRIAETYPFHPDLMDLVQNEWGKTQGFQRVRSTVSIFALAALHWSSSAADNSWVPTLIGVGDLPLGGVKSHGKVGQARCLEALLNSGLLLGNDRAIQGYRAVATTDITAADSKSGQAVELDRKLSSSLVDAGQPSPAVRMATALFNYSLVARSQGRRGATKAELMASLLLPANGAISSFSAVEEVFTALAGGDGLGALEVNRPSSNLPERYWLTIKQTLRMFFNSAKNQIGEDEAFALVWETAQDLASKGQFAAVHSVPGPVGTQTLSQVAGGFDSDENRLLLLDPRYWALLNGEDSPTRDDIRRILGVGKGALVVDNAASCVITAVNTYQRRYAVQAARDVRTWKLVAEQVIEGAEQDEVAAELVKARETLKEAVRKAFRHYAYLTRKGDQLDVVFARFDDDKQTTLSGNDVWGALVLASRAVGEFFDPTAKVRKRKPLAEEYLAILLAGFDRHLTLRDVVSSFYKNPRFPMVPTLDDIRGAIFKMLQPPDHAGPGTGGWELVGSDNSPIQVVNAQEIAINSLHQQIRKRRPPSEAHGDSDFAITDVDADSDLGTTADKDDAPTTVPAATTGGNAAATTSSNANVAMGRVKQKANSYSWYTVELENRSIVDEVKREDIRNHLRWLAAQLDNDQLDHQFITLKYEIMAAANPGLAADVKARANALDAKVQIRDEEI